ncbi:MAG: DUF4040 domain-containing protein [Synergistaceae bacterium]|nr:DUF4040 domain-containing protein [Synergistaceae bacterium]
MLMVEWLLLIFLIVCALSLSIAKNLLNSVIIFVGYSLVMSIMFIMLRSPDLAMTETLLGAGATGVLFFLTLRKIGHIGHEHKSDDSQTSS